jgi:hypothetical protein
LSLPHRRCLLVMVGEGAMDGHRKFLLQISNQRLS